MILKAFIVTALQEREKYIFFLMYLRSWKWGFKRLFIFLIQNFIMSKVPMLAVRIFVMNYAVFEDLFREAAKKFFFI